MYKRQEWDGAGAGIGNGGRHNGDTGSFIPVNGAETEPDTMGTALARKRVMRWYSGDL